MIIKSIRLSNFRSYQKKEFKFPSGTTLVVGPNRCGKTNLLEAIYLLATGRSFRAGVEREMIRYGEELARVYGVVAQFIARQKASRGALVAHQNFDSSTSEEVDSATTIRGVLPSESIKLEIVLTTGQVSGKRTAKKRCLINGVGKRRMDFVGQLRCVLFGPEDLEIILGSPSVRRNYLDDVLEQVDREYRRANLSYQKGLRQRNRILESYREAKFHPSSTESGRGRESFRERLRRQLYFWNNLLIKNGEIVTQKRGELIDFISQQPEYFGKLRVDYDKSVISPQRLEKYANQEVAAGMTLVGPHRDDFCIRMYPNENSPNLSESFDKLRTSLGRDLSIYGSRGEQRTAVLSLKLAEMEFVTQKTNRRPVLLLDDIFSELDQEHRARIFEIIPKQQTIITTTDLRLVSRGYREKVEIIKLL